MTRTLALPISALLLLAGGSVHAQTAGQDGYQEGIVADPMPATNAITKTEDTPVIEQNEEDRDGDLIGDGFDVDVVRETPDSDPAPQAGLPDELDPARATRGAEPDVEAGRGRARMFPGQIAPTNRGPTGRGRILAADLKEYKVYLADGQEVGTVERLIIDLQTGQLNSLIVSGGDGVLGIGDTRFEIPFHQVAAINTRDRALGVEVDREQLDRHRARADGDGEE